MAAQTDIRVEHDLLGEMALPADLLWGIHTERARSNFVLSDRRVRPELIRALAVVKQACCLANAELGYLTPSAAGAISEACRCVAAGDHADTFPLDAWQGGAGTSLNMNINEVLANLALLSLGRKQGDYEVIGPLDHVNRHQSTNDVYPTALKVAAIGALRQASEAVQALQGALQRKEQAWAEIPKLGRTERMPAVPMTLGQELGAMAEAVSRDRWRVFKCEERLRMVNLGGTAVGTGLAAPRAYIFLVIEKLRELTGLGLSRAENVPGETANADVFVEVSGILKAAAVNLMKIGDDLRLLHMLGELRLPPLQAGSSMMPGKVNPVVPESVIQVGIQIQANDMVVAQCASRASLQICEFLPLLGTALLESLGLLTNACRMLAVQVDAMQADPAACERYLNASTGIVTALVPAIGYARATQLVELFHAGMATDMRAFLVEQLGAHMVDEALSPQRLLALGYR